VTAAHVIVAPTETADWSWCCWACADTPGAVEPREVLALAGAAAHKAQVHGPAGVVLAHDPVREVDRRPPQRRRPRVAN
jgi:hypothetical protein